MVGFVCGHGAKLFTDHDLIEIGQKAHALKIGGGQTRAAVCFPCAGDELVEDDIFGFLAVECDVVRCLLLLLNGFLDGLDRLEQFILVNGLGQIILYAIADGSLRIREIRVSAQDDKSNRTRLGFF